MPENLPPLSDNDVKKETVNGIIDLLRHAAFYGHIIIQINRVFVKGESARFKTFAIGKAREELLPKMYVNMDYVRRIYKEAASKEVAMRQVMGVLEHEILHLIFGHLKMRMSDKVRSSVAVDLAVNSYIKEDKLPPGGQIPKDYGLEEKKGAFWYYQHLPDNPHYQQLCSSGAFGADGMLSNVVDSHSAWDEVEEDPLVSEIVKDIIRKAKELCNKNYGDVPGEIIQQIDDLLSVKKPIIPWQNVFRLFCASAAESKLDYTMKRTSRRFGTRPGTRKEDMLNLAACVDTSGSITDEQLCIFFNEVYWAWQNGALVTVVEADHAVQRVYKFEGKFTGKVHGRGGTSFEPALELCDRRFDGIIYFTDGDAGPVTKRYHTPILWVVNGNVEKKDFPCKQGRIISIGSEGI